ncbi:hypothetical protein QMK52_18665 [Pseudomonas sp. P9_2]|uniref:hypothetical protein n=1 Tax=Pseudomonas sp. P9_2 TaxID=3043447 RepID=UPI002A35EEB5|nr:hypothetical protein [Pseudomonas sp. P9_2]WPN50916.1 hypothetical protein QMK52_18665 [Pseudomonas sp. P9_2]
MKTLSATGIIRAMTRAATKAVRNDQVVRASVILMSPLLVFFLILALFMLVAAWKASTTGDAVIQTLRSVVLLLMALSTLFFKVSKVRRTHHRGVAVRDRIRSRRSGL